MSNFYWKISEKNNYRDSMKYLGFSDDCIDSILERINSKSDDDNVAKGIREKGYFYVSIENDEKNHQFYFGWNDFDCYEKYQYMGEPLQEIRRKKLKKINVATSM